MRVPAFLPRCLLPALLTASSLLAQNAYCVLGDHQHPATIATHEPGHGRQEERREGRLAHLPPRARAIFDFIAEHEITGCVLMGGDIQVSRALRYPMKKRIGYDLWQFIVSPMHRGTIASLDVPHPHLVHHAVEPHVFMRMVADTSRVPATLLATWINREGRTIFEVSLNENDLKR